MQCDNCNREVARQYIGNDIRNDCHYCKWWSYGDLKPVCWETHDNRNRAAHYYSQLAAQGLRLDEHYDVVLCREMGISYQRLEIARMDKVTAGRLPRAVRRIIGRATGWQ